MDMILARGKEASNPEVDNGMRLWVAALTGFVLLEKIGPAGVIVSRVAGAAVVVIGILFIAGIT